MEPKDIEVTAAIAVALAAGRARWPELAVAGDVFEAAVTAAVAGAADMPAAIRELAADDLYLACACRTGERAALDAFAARCDATLVGALRGMGLAPDAVDEIAQEVRTRLFVANDGPPKIASYSGRAQLTSWVRTVATRIAIDRARKPDAAVADDDAMLERVPDAADTPELAHFRDTYRDEFKQSFEEALASLGVRERNVLRHHFVDGLSLDEIGALYGVHKSTASRWIDGARVALSKRTRSNFHQRIKVVPAELDSILRLLQSQIDLSLSRLL